MDFEEDNMFQETIIDSLMFKRQSEINKILFSHRFQENYKNCEKIVKIFNSLYLEDLALDRRINQTELNLQLILENKITGFTSDEVKSAKVIFEYLQDIKIDFLEYQNNRSERIKCIKKYSARYEEKREEQKEENRKRFGEGVRSPINASSESPSYSQLRFICELQNCLSEDNREFHDRLELYKRFNKYIESPLAEITLRKWVNQLTTPSEYKKGARFKFLIHAIRSNKKIKIPYLKNEPIISTSLITDEFQGTYQNAKYGFVYQPTLENVMVIGSSDCYINLLPIKLSDITNIPHHFSLTYTPMTEKKCVFFTNHLACKTMHIEEIEKQSLQKQKREIQDSSHNDMYNEIVLINDAETNPIAVFLLETKDPNEFERSQATKLSKQLELPLVKI